jgi:HTH-type transcriptional regulator/antitoxin HigA
MDATLIVIDSDAELVRARCLVDGLMASDNPADLARLAAQARLIASYEEEKWPARRPSPAEVLRYIADQHGIKRVELARLLGTPERANEVMKGKRRLSLAIIQRLRARFRIPADLLLPPITEPARRHSAKRSAA